MGDDAVSRVVCVIQARQGSSRLPGKSLRPLQGRPLITHVVERARAIACVHAVTVATTDQDEDDELARVVTALDVPVFRGAALDVLDRVWHAAHAQGAATVIRVTGDCPFLDPAIADDVMHLYRSPDGWRDDWRMRYAWNDTAYSGFPDGTDVEVFGMSALTVAHQSTQRPDDREHVTTWLRRHCNVLTLGHTPPVDPAVKLSVDSWADYMRACAIAARLPRHAFSLQDTLTAWPSDERIMT